ncbi:MAG: VPLPA-CTERM sorting domain-containing protein [Desulfobacterales bacterium]|nr:VPLPA-CTERM sorting domain-containing protein [Desulfobacterales bacterium]
MKQIKFTFAALTAVCWILCTSTSAFAAFSGWATASLDYASIELDLGSNVTSSISYYAFAQYGDQTDTSSSASEALIEIDTDNWAWAEADTADSYEDIYAGVSVDNPATATISNAIAEYGISFTAAEAGTLAISIDYDLEIGASSTAYAEALAYLTINGETYDSAGIDFYAYNDMSKELSDLGTLTYSYSYTAGEEVTILLGADAYASAVPVPGAGLLLSTGLIVLAAIRRKS